MTERPTPLHQQPDVAVVVASVDRPALLAEPLDDLRRQTWSPLTVVVSVPDVGSAPPEATDGGIVVVGARGAAAQRNAGLDVVPDATHVFFFDDDAVVRDDYVEQAMAYFEAHPDVVGLTGTVLLDGAARAEVTRSEAVTALDGSRGRALTGSGERSRELYGCNFAYRPGLAAGERFDPRLPLYSWLEDHDLARRLMRHGSLAKIADAVIVHRGVKSGGREAHRRLGYSQVMNPVYLLRVGSFPLWLVLHEVVFRVGKNAVRSLAGHESSWRRKRLLGNAMAAVDVVRGRITPERILDIR